jgi:hypothetical protein
MRLIVLQRAIAALDAQIQALEHARRKLLAEREALRPAGPPPEAVRQPSRGAAKKRGLDPHGGVSSCGTRGGRI